MIAAAPSGVLTFLITGWCRSEGRLASYLRKLINVVHS
jgi:hypothetical protein